MLIVLLVSNQIYLTVKVKPLLKKVKIIKIKKFFKCQYPLNLFYMIFKYTFIYNNNKICKIQF